MNGPAFLARNLGIGGDRGLTTVGVSERISLTISSSRRGWLGGGDLLMLPCLVVVLELEMWAVLFRGGVGLLVLTQQPIGLFWVSGDECGLVWVFSHGGRAEVRRRGGGGVE